MEEKIDLLQFVPSQISVKRTGNNYKLEMEYDDEEIMLYYFVNCSNWMRANCGKRQFSAVIPRYINRNQRIFEVFGLLQAELSKTHDRKIAFANCEPNIINLVMVWFKDELGVDYKEWKWYIKLNLNKPEDESLRVEIEDGVIEDWMKNSLIVHESKYNTGVSYIKNTKNQTAANNGTLIIELNSKVFTQLIHNMLMKIQKLIVECKKEEIIGYMRGIIAGEGSIEINRKFKKYCVHISACKKEERDLYQRCLAIVGVALKQYENYKETIISKKFNNFKLLELDLMSLNPTKYAKFLEMLSLYKDKSFINEVNIPKEIIIQG